MSKATRVVLSVGTVVVTALILGTCAHRSGDREAVARYKRDLKATGEKLTYVELGFPREPEQGGSFDLLHSSANALAGKRLQPGLLDIVRFVGPGEVRVCWQMPQPPFNSSWNSVSNALIIALTVDGPSFQSEFDIRTRLNSSSSIKGRLFAFPTP